MDEPIQNETEYLVVGASFAGSLLAAKFASHGPTLLIDKSEPGTFMNCGGGLPRETFDSLRIDIPRQIINQGVMDFGASRCSFPCNYVVVDRSELDSAVCRAAKMAGAQFRKLCYTGHDPVAKTASFRRQGGEKVSIRYRKLVLALGCNPVKEPFTGKQRRPSPHGLAQVEIIAKPSPEPSSFIFGIFRGKNPGYSWVFPMPGGRVNAGSGSFGGTDARRFLLQNMKRQLKIDDKIIRKGGGVIPLSVAWKIQRRDSFVFGDAAGMVNPLNGEGLKHIANFADKFVSAVSKGKNANFAWLTSGTFIYLLTATLAFKSIVATQRMLSIDLYPAACRLVAFIRRNI